MQDRYVGDIGDFGKYGLLRELFGHPEEPGSGCGLRLGVAWYFNEEEGNSGGSLREYRKLRECDPWLYDSLQRLIKNPKPKVAEVENSRILPNDTRYHRDLFCSSMRTKWFKGALNETEGADVVFVDPDNGIASKNTPVGSPKHVLPYELERFYERGQSLIIYHHLARTDARTLIKSLSKQLQEWLDPPHKPWALWYRRGTGRVYFVVPSERHIEALERWLQQFTKKTCWFKRQPGFQHPHFELVKAN